MYFTNQWKDNKKYGGGGILWFMIMLHQTTRLWVSFYLCGYGIDISFKKEGVK